MKVFTFVTLLLAGVFAAEAFRIPDVLERRESTDFSAKRDVLLNDLVKRKGGGGGGKGSGSSGSSSGSSSGGSSSSGGRSSGSSNAGGTTSAGSGAARGYGGGKYYGGGATTPYSAGSKSPKGIAPVALLGVGALVFFPGLWLYGAYMYPYSHPYGFHNASSNRNETKNVNCLCQQYSVCGCDDNDDKSYLNGIIGNGTNLNQTLVRVADVNGTSQIFLNGTLPNGTTASGSTNAASGTHGKMFESMGWCVIGSIFATAMWAL
jgi:hypothetical protein